MQHLGDAEVEKLRSAIDGNQDVARLEVAMHQEAPMRVRHRGTNLLEELEALADGQQLLVAEMVDRHPHDPLHD